MAIDLASVKECMSQDTVIEIHDPKGDDLGIRITVYSPDSEQYRKAVNMASTKTMDRVYKRIKPSAEEVEKRALDVLVASVKSWSGVMWGGQEIECTPENVRNVFETFPFIREQVDDVVGKEVNFFKK